MKIKKIIELEDRIRFRTPEELQIRKNEFLKICKLLNKLNIQYFLHSGILLGAVREKGFIPWDWDIEISVNSNEVFSKIDILLSELNASNFYIIKFNKNPLNLKIDFKGKLSENVTLYTILGWNHDKNKKFYWRKKTKIPDHFLINKKKIRLFNTYHYAPDPAEKYLEYMYGNWRIPLRTYDKNLYLSKNFYGRRTFKNFFKIIRNFILRILIKIK